jgi:hypothetical protein
VGNGEHGHGRIGCPRPAQLYFGADTDVFEWRVYEYAAQGITVNNIPPGYIDTPMLRATARNFAGTVDLS